jgi:hypothetical protein
MVDIARFDAIHQSVYQAAMASIQLMEHYCHQTVLEVLNYDARSVSINWPRIREAVAETMAAELMPLGFFFFAQREATKEGYSIPTHPEKYLAIGHGKTTYGYGLVSAMPDELVQCWMGLTGAHAKGHLQKHKNVYDTAVNGGKKIGNTRSPQQIAGDYIPASDDGDDEVDIFS